MLLVLSLPLPLVLLLLVLGLPLLLLLIPGLLLFLLIPGLLLLRLIPNLSVRSSLMPGRKRRPRLIRGRSSLLKCLPRAGPGIGSTGFPRKGRTLIGGGLVRLCRVSRGPVKGVASFAPTSGRIGRVRADRMPIDRMPADRMPAVECRWDG